MAKMDGIVGLGFEAISVNKHTPIVPFLKKAGDIDSNVVTFRLSHKESESDMIIGGEDPSYRSEEFTYHKLTADT